MKRAFFVVVLPPARGITELCNRKFNYTTMAKKRTTDPRTHAQHRVQLFSAVLLIIVGCAMMIGAFMVPPTGEIHPSVLIGFGEILTFVGALFGIDYHYKAKNFNP